MKQKTNKLTQFKQWILSFVSNSVCETDVKDTCKKCLTHQCSGCLEYDG